MKKYFSYINTAREACQKPCVIDFEGRPYTSFCNAYSLVLTKESCGEMRLFADVDRYPNTTRLVKFDGVGRNVDLNKVFAEAKALGYKLKKSEVNGNGYLMHYDGAYYRIGLVESSYKIIDDGEEAAVFHAEDAKFSPITIQTSVGVAVIMAVRYEPEEGDGVVIIEVE